MWNWECQYLKIKSPKETKLIWSNKVITFKAGQSWDINFKKVGSCKYSCVLVIRYFLQFTTVNLDVN